MNAKQEILDALKKLDPSDFPGEVGRITGIGYRDTESRIRAILEAHTLEPIDEREFDPTLCGFEMGEVSSSLLGVHQNVWQNSKWHMCTTWSDTHDPTCIVQYDDSGRVGRPYWLVVYDGNWPETQSDGEKLLKLLGVLG